VFDKATFDADLFDPFRSGGEAGGPRAVNSSIVLSRGLTPAASARRPLAGFAAHQAGLSTAICKPRVQVVGGRARLSAKMHKPQARFGAHWAESSMGVHKPQVRFSASGPGRSAGGRKAEAIFTLRRGDAGIRHVQ